MVRKRINAGGLPNQTSELRPLPNLLLGMSNCPLQNLNGLELNYFGYFGLVVCSEGATKVGYLRARPDRVNKMQLLYGDFVLLEVKCPIWLKNLKVTLIVAYITEF